MGAGRGEGKFSRTYRPVRGTVHDHASKTKTSEKRVDGRQNFLLELEDGGGMRIESSKSKNAQSNNNKFLGKIR